MKIVVNAEQMRQADRLTTEHYLIPEAVLMERAALASVEEILHRYPAAGRILVVCGCGNNGADGFAIARLLLQHGKSVTALLCGNPQYCSELNTLQMHSALRYGLQNADSLEAVEYDIIIDAVFGIGLDREISGEYQVIFEKINRMELPVVAIDMPSGIHTDTGMRMGSAIRAAVTITFSYEKTGLLTGDGPEYAGEVCIRPIGITEASFLGKLPVRRFLEEADIPELLPVRAKAGNKGSFGKLLIIAGNEEISGALELAARSAYRMGAGMVRVMTTANNEERIKQACPEALVTIVTPERIPEKEIRWADVTAIGPGIGTGSYGRRLVRQVIELAGEQPVVMDADALNVIATEPELQKMLCGRAPGRTILTPHPGELARLLHKDIPELKKQFCRQAEEFSTAYHVILAAKEARTYVCNPAGQGYFNLTGNDGMATAGAGDVLTGIIASLCAQKIEPFTAATLGVYLHGVAGDLASQKLGNDSVMATDLVEAIPDTLKKYRKATVGLSENNRTESL